MQNAFHSERSKAFENRFDLAMLNIVHTCSAMGLVDIQCILADYPDWFDKWMHLLTPTRTRVKLRCSGSSRGDTLLSHHIPTICKMNSRKQLAVLLLMLVCTGRTDAQGLSFFYDWFNGDWISFDERGRIKH